MSDETTETTADEVLRENGGITLAVHCPACDGKQWENASDSKEKAYCVSCGYIIQLTGEFSADDKAVNDLIVAEQTAEFMRRQEEVNRAAVAHLPQRETRLERITLALVARWSPEHLMLEVQADLGLPYRLVQLAMRFDQEITVHER